MRPSERELLFGMMVFVGVIAALLLLVIVAGKLAGL